MKIWKEWRRKRVDKIVDKIAKEECDYQKEWPRYKLEVLPDETYALCERREEPIYGGPMHRYYLNSGRSFKTKEEGAAAISRIMQKMKELKDS